MLMKLTVFTLASFVVLSSPLFAAELPSTLAPPAPPPSGSPWEGFYGGGHTGFAFATSSYSTNPAGTPATGTVGLYGWDGQFGPLEGGFQAGYNHVLPTGLMLGAEAQFSFLNVMKSNLPVTFAATGPSMVADKMEIYGALRGRVGYAFGNVLIFGAGGFAYDRDEATATDTAGNVDSGYFWRPGWTAGAGAEVLLTPNVSATLEYSYFDFASSGVAFPIAGERYTTGLTLQTVQLGLNYRFNGNDSAPAGSGGFFSDSDPKNWSVHAQSTVIGQANAPFPAAYSGPNSLYNGFQVRDTFSVTGYLGYKAPEGTEFYFNPEPFQGFGLSSTHGLGGFPNMEAQKAGIDFPHYNTARLFLRQIWGLGGEQEDLADGQNQVAEKVVSAQLPRPGMIFRPYVLILKIG
jgi:high affinity Mn2+ porin